MTIVARHWVPSAAVVPQERGPDYLAAVDGADWSEGRGFHRGFFSTFRVREGKDVWFHFPLPTPVEVGGKPVYLDSVSLLWECLEGASIGWICLQHGGMDRLALTDRLVSPVSVPVPHDVPEEWRAYHPDCERRLTELALTPRLPLRFGVQLCVMIRCPDADGTVRFFGAGAAFSDEA
jgi:hypothetical protein